MPTYEYQCGQCGDTLEVMQKITEEPLKECPQCGQVALVRKPGGGIGLQFTGSGFYITDYKNDSQSCEKGESCPCK